MIKCFTKNKDGKIEFTQKELEKLLNEIYKSGYDDANNRHYWWTSPYYYSTSPYYNYCYSTTSAGISTATTADLGTDTKTNVRNSGATLTCNTLDTDNTANLKDYIKVVC